MRQTLLFGHIIRREALNSIMTGQISGWQSELDRGKMLDSLLWWHGRMSSIEFNQSTRDQNWVHPEHQRSKLDSSRASKIKIGGKSLIPTPVGKGQIDDTRNIWQAVWSSIGKLKCFIVLLLKV